MPLGQHENSQIYLNVSFGKLRQKANAETKGAVQRENKNNEMVWELVYGWITGKIVGIYYKEHPEYGNSYDVVMDDGNERYCIVLNEDSRYCQDFLNKLPNIDLDKDITITPYDFVPRDSDKSKKGLSIKQNGQKIGSFFVEKNENGFTYKHGFPERDGMLPKAEWKIYLIKVQEFLKKYTLENIIPKLSNQPVSEDQNPEGPPPHDDDDLPF